MPVTEDGPLIVLLPAGRLMRCQPFLSVCVLVDRGKCQNSHVHFSHQDDKGNILGAGGSEGEELGKASALPIG